jgi:hypothetical protein
MKEKEKGKGKGKEIVTGTVIEIERETGIVMTDIEMIEEGSPIEMIDAMTVVIKRCRLHHRRHHHRRLSLKLPGLHP